MTSQAEEILSKALNSTVSLKGKSAGLNENHQAAETLIIQTVTARCKLLR